MFLCGLGVVGQNSKYVDPIIGTKAMGHTFSGAAAPHGIVAQSPDTDTILHKVNGVYQKDVYKYCAGYQYDDPTIVGFSHTLFRKLYFLSHYATLYLISACSR